MVSSLLPDRVLANIRAFTLAPGVFPDTLTLQHKNAQTKTDYGADSAPTYADVATIPARVHPTRTEMVVKPDNSLIYVTRCRFATPPSAPVAAGQSVVLHGDRYTLLNTDVDRAWLVERVVDCERDTTTG